MRTKEFKKDFWRYYLILEERFIVITNYIEPSTDNFGVFSLELSSMLQSICAEVEAVMRTICGYKKDEESNITNYSKIILEKYPTITEWIVESEILDQCRQPYKGWTLEKASKSLVWWEAHNKVKHSRLENLKAANFENVLLALMGLYALEMNWFEKMAKSEDVIDILEENSKLFSIRDVECRYVSGGDLEFPLLNNRADFDFGDEDENTL